MLRRNWSEKLGAKSPSTALGYSVVRVFYLVDAFSEILKLINDSSSYNNEDHNRAWGRFEYPVLISDGQQGFLEIG